MTGVMLLSRYALAGNVSGELLTYNGRVLVHDDRAELEFLFPRTRVVRITDGELGQPVMSIKDHPGLTAIRWPLNRGEFVDAG